MYEVVTLGEVMVVVYPCEPLSLVQTPTLAIGIAGAESNLAIGLSQLGHRVHFISRVGHDPFGQRIRAALATEDVDVAGLLIDNAAPTGVFFREWLPDGQRRVFYYRSNSAASRLAPDDLHPEAFADIRLLHVSGITPALSDSCAATVKHAIELAHSAGALVSFDPNYRSALWDQATAREVLLPLMTQTDILLMGHEDSQALLGVDERESVFAFGRELHIPIVVFKEGERGASAQAGETCVSIPAQPVVAAIDPVGAGDAFNAGFLSGWLRGEALEASLHLGAQRGAAIVAISGDYSPRERDHPHS